MKRIVLLGSGIVLFAVAACSGGSTAAPEPPTTVAASGAGEEAVTSASPSAPPRVSSSQVGDCWDSPSPVTQADSFALNPKARKVPCAAKHTVEVVYVTSMPEGLTTNPYSDLRTIVVANRDASGDFDAEALTGTAKTAYEEAAHAAVPEGTLDACADALRRTVSTPNPSGGWESSIFSAAVTGPTDDDWNAGDRAITCMAYADQPVNEGAASKGLMPLPSSLKNILHRAEGLQFHYCYTARMNPVCGSKGSGLAWMQVLNDLPQPIGKPWVSQKNAQAVADRACRKAVRVYQKPEYRGDSARSYGWGSYTGAESWDTQQGFTKETWGTDKAVFNCVIAAYSYQPYTPSAAQ